MRSLIFHMLKLKNTTIIYINASFAKGNYLRKNMCYSNTPHKIQVLNALSICWNLQLQVGMRIHLTMEKQQE